MSLLQGRSILVRVSLPRFSEAVVYFWRSPGLHSARAIPYIAMPVPTLLCCPSWPQVLQFNGTVTCQGKDFMWELRIADELLYSANG